MRFKINPALPETGCSVVASGEESDFVSSSPIKKVPLALLAAAVAACPMVAMAYTPPPTDFFPVGVFLQPSSSFDIWKSRGVNTVVDFFPDPGLSVPQQQDALNQWNTAAVQRGLYMIRAPRANAV